MLFLMCVFTIFFFSSRRRHTRCALVTGVQTCALPILFGILGGIGPDPEDLMHMRRTADRLFGDNYQWSILGAGRNQISLATMGAAMRSEEHTSELQSLMRISYAVFCLTKKKRHVQHSTSEPIPHNQ